MLRLCGKDFMAGRWWWLLFTASYVLYFTFPLMQRLGLMVGAVALITACVFVTLFLEDRYKTETFYASLPLRRSSIVLARYILTGLLSLAGLAFVFLYGYLLTSVVKLRWMTIDLGSLLSLDGITGFALFTAFLAALYFPFYFRHGLAKGSFIFAAVLLGLAIVLAGAERLAANVLHLTETLFTAEFLKDPGLGIVRAIGTVRDSAGLPLFVGAAFILLAGMLAVSIRLSIRFYQKREF
jgi:ABC-2 family transporter protein